MAIRVRGFLQSIIETTQQIALLAASLRRHESGKIMQSDVSVNFSNNPSRIWIEARPLEPLIDTESSCWHPLFGGSILARGFPIPPRSGEVGAEIPYSVMTLLARIWYPVIYKGGVVLKEFSTMLVPTDCASDSIQWHLISNMSGERLPTNAIKSRLGTWCKIEQFETLSQKRAFLGFCTKAMVLLGTPQGNYESVGYCSYVQRAGRRLGISGGSVGVTLASHELPGPIFGVNFTLSKPQAIVQNLDRHDFKGMLTYVQRRSLILYDVDVKKSWLVSALSTMLHMVHIWARLNPALTAVNGTRVGLPFAKASWDGGKAALEAIEKDPLLELYKNPGGEPYRLMDLVKKIWGNLESAIDRLEEQTSDSFRLQHGRTVTAWELMDMVNSEPLTRPKETRVERTGGGWQLLADDVVTLFCSGLGDIVVPDTSPNYRSLLCPGWETVPSMQDYMIASASAVHDMSATCGRNGLGYTRLTDQLALFSCST